MSDGLPPPGSFDRCWCTGVTRAEVLAAWRRGLRTPETLRTALGVCGGCGTCRPELQRLLRELARGEGVV